MTADGDDRRNQEKQRFAAGLRDLAERAGLTQQQVRRNMTAPRPAQTISDLLLGTGVKAPELALVLDFVAACAKLDRHGRLSKADVDPERWRKRHRELEGALKALAAAHRAQRAGRLRSTLPSDVPGFVGRDRELGAVAGMINGAVGGRPQVVAIDGMPGCGKTALAIRAAHANAAAFPDGRFYVPLHAHTPDQARRAPAEVLDELLQLIGVGSREIPGTLEAKSALWRQRVEGTRTLVVLDDASDPEQVRPLLPGGGTCLVIVTSRPLLMALDDVRPLHVSTLPAEDAAALLRELAFLDPAQDRDLDADLGKLVELAGCLPLAIRVLAAWLRHHPTWTLCDLIGLLSTADDRSAAVRAGDVGIDRAFTLSYESLPSDQRSLFRQLGLHPGPEYEAEAIGALAGVDADVARRLLDGLYQANLLDETARGRFRMHDLLRDHARALADPAAQESLAAVARLHDHYRSVVDRAVALAEQDRDVPAVDRTSLHTAADARRWLATELPNLVACVERAAGPQQPTAIALALTLSRYLYLDGRWTTARRVYGTALDAARAVGDQAATARLLVELATVQRLTGLVRESEAGLTEALVIAGACDDPGAEAAALVGMAWLHLTAGRHAAALESLDTAVALCRRVADLVCLADATALAGIVRFEMDDIGAGEPALTAALALFRELGFSRGVADTLTFRGDLRRKHGDFHAAEDDLTTALELYDRLDERHGRTCALGALATMRLDDGDRATARAQFTEVLQLHREMGNGYGEAYALAFLGRIAAGEGHAADAVALLREAIGLHEAIPNPAGAAEARTLLADVVASGVST